MLRRTPLRRKKGLAPGGRLKRSALKRRRRKARATDDPIRRTLVKSLPCARCSRPGPSECHHPRDMTGMGLRASDAEAFALCHRCHHGWLHDSGITREEKRAFQREAIEATKPLVDFPVIVLIFEDGRWHVWGSYINSVEVGRAWAASASYDDTDMVRRFWWSGPREEAVRLLKDPNYTPTSAKESA